VLKQSDLHAGRAEYVYGGHADVRMIEVGERIDEENGGWGRGIGDWGDW
jgi:hypothetical protein